MINELPDVRVGQSESASHRKTVNLGIQIALWAGWALLVAGFFALRWWMAADNGQPVDFFRIGLHTVLVGLGGVIALTLIEMRFDPERFHG